MEHVRSYEKRDGVDVFYGNKYNLHPANGEARVGSSGIDKDLPLEQLIALAYQTVPRPNIIVKGGPNAKWYLKRCPVEEIEGEITKQQEWRDVSRCTMHIIVWDE